MLRHSSDRIDSSDWFKETWGELTAPLRGKVIDVGSGIGDEPLLLASLPNVTEVIAYDTGYQLEELEKNIKNKYDPQTMAKITVCNKPEDAPVNCDSAFSWNASEHFIRPIEDMEFICSRLKTGGIWSGRHYNYYSPANGHHLATEYHRPFFNRFCKIHGHQYPHLSMAEKFTTDFRSALRIQHLNMITLYQLRMYAIVAGFEISSWAPSYWGSKPPVENSFLSFQDMITVAIHFKFTKAADPARISDRLPEYLIEASS